jgi:hypothetical protein
MIKLMSSPKGLHISIFCKTYLQKVLLPINGISQYKTDKKEHFTTTNLGHEKPQKTSHDSSSSAKILN